MRQRESAPPVRGAGECRGVGRTCQCEGGGQESRSWRIEDGGWRMENWRIPALSGGAQASLSRAMAAIVGAPRGDGELKNVNCKWALCRRYNAVMGSDLRTTVGFWAIVVVVSLLLLYSLSFGPACWINRWTGVGSRAMAILYRPVSGFLDPSTTAGGMLNWYARLGVEDGVFLNWGIEEGPHWFDAMSKSDLSPLPVVWPFDPPRDSGLPRDAWGF
jgi:hypothetical protein